MATNSIDTLFDRELLERTVRVAGDERHVTADLLALIGEIDARRLYLGEGCSSLFTYCTQVLRLSEHAAYHRIEGARAARLFPIILELVADGSVTLTTVAMLRPHLTKENHEALLAAARHKTKREVEQQIASLAPRPDARTVIRRLPTRDTGDSGVVEPAIASGCSGAPTGLQAVATSDREGSSFFAPVAVSPMATDPRPRIAPLAVDRYLLRVTLTAGAHANLRRAQQLLGHSVPDGNPAVIIEKALALLVADLERAKIANVRRPRPESGGPSASSGGSRHIPAPVRRQVWARDEGRCAFVGSHGRCSETSRLEFHHLVPFARGGPTNVQNLALRCRAHNRFDSEEEFGPWEKRVVDPTIPSDSP